MEKVSVLELSSPQYLKSKSKNIKPIFLNRINIIYKSAIFLIFVIMIIFCNFPKSVFAKENKPETIRLQLRWDNQFQFAGYYVADWNGYYKDEGLSVEMVSALKNDLNIATFIFNPNKFQKSRGKYFKKSFAWIIMILIVLLIIIFAWVYSLKKLVNKKTKKIIESENRFRSVFENTNDTICVTNQQDILFVNPSFEKMFGYKQEESCGKNVLELTTPEFRRIFSNNIKKRLKNEEAQNLYDVLGLRRDGSVFNLEAKISTFKQEGVLYTIAIMRDITEQKMAVEEIKAAKEKAEKLSMSKSEFIANMSHELRTPLNVNIAAIQLFQSYVKSDLELDKEKISKHLKPMTQNCLRLLRLVNNLIDTTKIDAGFYEPHFKNYDIINLIEGIVLSVADYVKQKNIDLIFDTEVEELIIRCDIDMIERIMLNIMSNAIKFTDDCVNVNIYIRDNAVIIVVKDNGPGIEIYNQKTIFQRYKQVEDLFTRENEGSGIGLSLTKSLVEMHGGNINVKSEYGKGAEFVIEIPIKHHTSYEFIQSEINDQNYNDKFIEKMKVEFSDIYK